MGYAIVWDEDPHVRLHASVDIHPQYKGCGLGTHLALPKAPEGTRVVVRQGKAANDAASGELLLRHGYQVVRYFLQMEIEMSVPPPDPVLPGGISIRTFVRDQDLRALIEADRDAFRDHWGFVEHPLEQQYREWVHVLDTDSDHDPSLWFLAMDGKEIAGIALCRPRIIRDPDMGHIDTLGVRRPWRRQGVGLALLHHCFGEFYRRGKHKVSLGVDASSLTGATRLYERAGMHAAQRWAAYEKELRPGRDLTTQRVE